MTGGLGRADAKAKFRHMFSNSRAVNILAAARIFLFASRDVWFVVGLPVFLRTRARLVVLGGRHVHGGLGDRLRDRPGVGAADRARARAPRARAQPDGRTAAWLAFVLAAFPAAIAIALSADVDPTLVIVVGLIAFGVVFALNSAVHSYLILAYADGDKVAMNVGFYYMANAVRAPRRDAALRPALPVAGPRGVPVGVGDLRARRRAALVLLPTHTPRRSTEADTAGAPTPA